LTTPEAPGARDPYDVRVVRAHFPALQEGAAHFDGPGGSQVPDVVAEAVAGILASAVSNRGRLTRAEQRADDVVLGFRSAMADLLGADPGGIVYGRSMTQLTYDFSRTLAKAWGPDDEVVVTRLDHDANVRPWIQAAAGAGATVRWVTFDPETGELDAADVAAALSERTRVVAVTGASNLIGSRPPILAISALVHAAGALLYVDGVHLTPHAPIDVEALGADFYACSPYKFLGPHCGVVAASPALLESLQPDKLLPATDAVPERFEYGTLPYELLGGTTAAVDFLAALAPGSGGSRRTRILAAMRALEHYEDSVGDKLLDGLAAIDRVVIYGQAKLRTPTVLFSVDGVPSPEVSEHLAGLGVNAPAGSFYALEASRRLGLGDRGAIRAGVAPYTDDDDVSRLVAGVVDVVRRT
jgi:cysteine desulfurase family protein (TIGR01976 family)